MVPASERDMRRGRRGELMNQGTEGRLIVNAEPHIASATERRRNRRFNLYLPIRVTGIGQEGEWHEETTCTVNVSQRGVYFITAREFPVGASLAIMFAGVRFPEMIVPLEEYCCRARVVHRDDFAIVQGGAACRVQGGAGAVFEDGFRLAFLGTFGGEERVGS